MAKQHNRSLEEMSRSYISSVKERYHGLTAETFEKFRDFLLKYSQKDAEPGDRAKMLSEVNAMFTKYDDLIADFRYFLYYLDDHNPGSSSDRSTSSVESKGEEDEADRLSRRDRKSVQKVVSTSLDFVNKVKRVLKGEKFQSFIATIVGFQQHKDIKRVEREAFHLFKEHPELEIEFCEFLAEAKAGRTVQDMLASRKRRREKAEAKCAGHKEKVLSEYEQKLADIEDDLHIRDLKYNWMLSAKAAAERLIMKNSGRNEKEKICVGDYFSVSNLWFMKEVLNWRNQLLHDNLVTREKAIIESKRIVERLEKKIDFLTRDWSEEKKRFAKVSREEELQVPVFDWHELMNE